MKLFKFVIGVIFIDRIIKICILYMYIIIFIRIYELYIYISYVLGYGVLCYFEFLYCLCINRML